MSTRRFTVGLTGGIGSGKSTVADKFQALGAGIVDTDAIAHEITAAGGGAMAAIRTRFGEHYLRADGSLDRAAMRALVFADAEAKAALEAILHPLIRARVHNEMRERPEPYVLLVVPLLLETGGYTDLVDHILVVDCPEELQIARVMRRSGLSEDQVRAIMSTQLSRQARLDAADAVIDNALDPAALDAQVRELDQRYRLLGPIRHRNTTE